MVSVNAQNLPWVLIGLLTSALLAVFYAMLRGHIMPSRIADQLRESSERRAEIAEAGAAANTDSVESLVDSMGRLLVLAEKQGEALSALREGRYRNWGGS